MTETRAPRNTFFDEDSTLVPTITITLNGEYDTIVVLPQTISILSESVKAKQIGEIAIEYKKVEEVADEEEYDEEEYLYNAIANKVKYPSLKVPILKFNRSLFITVPYFQSTITYNFLASELESKLKGTWIILSPSSLNNNQSLNVLYNENSTVLSLPHIGEIPFLKPPHFITGIGGSLVSRLNVRSPENVLSVILNSEGQPGFEKSDSDSIVDAAYVLSEIVSKVAVEREDYVKGVSFAVRKFNGFSNLGMYI